MKKILALDLGTKTGYAFEAGNYPMACGTWTLATDKELKTAEKFRLDRLRDIRVEQLWKLINRFYETVGIDLLVWEDVQFSSSTAQTQLWSSLRSALWISSIARDIRVECCHVGTLKKFATGYGNATKEMMAISLSEQDPRFSLSKGVVIDTVSGSLLTDDAVDAIHLLRWAKSITKHESA